MQYNIKQRPGLSLLSRSPSRNIFSVLYADYLTWTPDTEKFLSPFTITMPFSETTFLMAGQK